MLGGGRHLQEQSHPPKVILRRKGREGGDTPQISPRYCNKICHFGDGCTQGHNYRTALDPRNDAERPEELTDQTDGSLELLEQERCRCRTCDRYVPSGCGG